MRLPKPFYRLPLRFDVERLRAEVAALAAHFAYQFLVRRELTQMATCFTLEPPITQSVPLTKPEILAAFRR